MGSHGFAPPSFTLIVVLGEPSITPLTGPTIISHFASVDRSSRNLPFFPKTGISGTGPTFPKLPGPYI